MLVNEDINNNLLLWCFNSVQETEIIEIIVCKRLSSDLDLIVVENNNCISIVILLAQYYLLYVMEIEKIALSLLFQRTIEQWTEVTLILGSLGSEIITKIRIALYYISSNNIIENLRIVWLTAKGAVESLVTTSVIDITIILKCNHKFQPN